MTVINWIKKWLHCVAPISNTFI